MYPLNLYAAWVRRLFECGGLTMQLAYYHIKPSDGRERHLEYARLERSIRQQLAVTLVKRLGLHVAPPALAARNRSSSNVAVRVVVRIVTIVDLITSCDVIRNPAERLRNLVPIHSVHLCSDD